MAAETGFSPDPPIPENGIDIQDSRNGGRWKEEFGKTGWNHIGKQFGIL